MKEFNFSLIENGPIKLDIIPKEETFNDILFNSDGSSIELKKSAFLCRCGKTNKQPYCDGTHKKVGFSSAKEIKEEIEQFYEGKEISITFNRSICAGAAICVDKFSNIYSSEGSTNWINPNKGSKDEVIASIKNCPSGALSYKINEINKNEKLEKVSIKVIKNGPLIINNIKLKNVIFSKNACEEKYTLCRCGASKNRPFCDYTHASLKDESYTF